MDKGADDFGAAVREALGSRGLSLRQAQIKTNIDHTTILKMSKGWRPKKGVLIDFAVGLSEPINKWLQLAGYDPLPTEPVKTAGSEPPGEVGQATESQQPEVPEAVLEAIAQAGSREEKIQLAFDYLRRPELGLQMGSSQMQHIPTEAKIALIRLYERLSGREILPKEIV